MGARSPYVKIPLTRGKVALVSPEDAERVLGRKWYASPQKKKVGLVWRVLSSVRIDGKTTNISLHRFILNLGPATPDVDHKNGNPLDCRRGNIREATRSQNIHNRRKFTKYPYRGITKLVRGGRWGAEIRVDGRSRFLGSFATQEEAAHAFDEAARELYGEFACVNFPREGERRAW